jgi:P27 family predicted phage terminase small subunit
MPNIAKPTKLKDLAGNPGKRALNRKEPQPKGAPLAPATMSPAAKQVWTQLVASMPRGVFTTADSAILAAYCEAVANHRQATAAIMESPAQVQGSTGQPVLNPWFKQQAEAARQICTFGQRLGLDPIARQAINTETDDEDDWGGLIN